MKIIQIILLLMLLPVMANAGSLQKADGSYPTLQRADGTTPTITDASGNQLYPTTTTTSTTTTTTSTTTTTLTYWGQFDWDFAYNTLDLDNDACDGSPCGDGDDVTAWNDLKGSYDLTVPPQAIPAITPHAPSLDIDACPNSTPGIYFNPDKPDYANGETLYNSSLSCLDANRSCTWVVISRWVSLPTVSQEAFLSTNWNPSTGTNQVNYNRGKLYSYQTGATKMKTYNGAMMLGRLSQGGVFDEEDEDDPASDIDTDFHGYVWHMDGYTDNGYNTLSIDELTDHFFVGPNARFEGITIASARTHDSKFAEQEFCAMGLYKGDVTQDANWKDLQQYACDTWGVGLKTVCDSEATGITVTGIDTITRWDVWPSVPLDIRPVRNDYFRVGAALITNGTGDWEETASIALQWDQGLGDSPANFVNIPTSSDDIYSPSDPVTFSNIQDANYHTAQIYSDTPGTYYIRAVVTVPGNPSSPFISANSRKVTVYDHCDTTHDCTIYVNTDDLGAGQISDDVQCANGNGTWYSPYCSLQAAVTGLVNDGLTDISGWSSGINLYFELSGSTADVQANITGITTDSDNQIFVSGTSSGLLVLTEQGKLQEASTGDAYSDTGYNDTGIWDDTYWHAVHTATGDNQATISSDIDYITVRNLQCEIIKNGYSNVSCIKLTGSNAVIDEVIIKGESQLMFGPDDVNFDADSILLN